MPKRKIFTDAHFAAFANPARFFLLLSTLFCSSQAYAGTACQAIFLNVDPEAIEQSVADLQKCREEIVERASRQDASAQILRSQLALRGIGENRSRRNARIILETASAHGNALAKRLLANLLVSKVGAEKQDYLNAEALYKEAATLGDKKSNSKLAQLYVAGVIPNKSDANALELFKTADDGDARAKLGRAKILLAQPDARKSLADASNLLLEASRLGDPEATFLFAIINLNNGGHSLISKSDLQLMLCGSAEKGHAPAMYECARHYLFTKDITKAMKLLEEASNAGHINSIELLADYYSKFDAERAKTLWFRAATLGSDVAKLALLYRFHSLTRAEQLNVNGAFKDPDAFTSDAGRIMLGNHFLSIVEKGKNGEYVKGEYWYYMSALKAFSLVEKSPNKPLAAQAEQIARLLRDHRGTYEKDLEARRFQRKLEFWAAIGAATVSLLKLSGNQGTSPTAPSVSSPDSCAGLNGGGLWGMSPGAISLFGCNPYKIN